MTFTHRLIFGECCELGNSVRDGRQLADRLTDTARGCYQGKLVTFKDSCFTLNIRKVVEL